MIWEEFTILTRLIAEELSCDNLLILLGQSRLKVRDLRVGPMIQPCVTNFRDTLHGC